MLYPNVLSLPLLFRRHSRSASSMLPPVQSRNPEFRALEERLEVDEEGQQQRPEKGCAIS